MKPSSKVAVQAIAALSILAPTVYPQANPPDPASIAPVINPPNPQTNIVISLADYLIDQNGHPVSPYLAVMHALDACRAQRAAKLVIPTGHYVFDDPQIAQGIFHAGVFSLSDFIIDGQGSDFVFHFPRTGFLIQDCQRIVIRNLRVDTDLALASLGVAHKAGGNTNIRFLNSYPVSANTPLVAISPYDITKLKWKAIPGEIFNPRNVTMIAPQTFTSPDFASLADGEEVIVRHYTYEGHAFVVYGNTTADIGIENVTIYGAPGMGFSFSADRGFRLSDDRIVRKPGRPISTATDGCHFTNTRGDILVENCDFSGQGDDSLNLASLWIPITHIDSARTFVATRQVNDLLVQQGSQLKLVRANDLSELGRVNVTQVTYDSASGRFSITVDRNLPANLAAGDLMINLTQSNPKFLIRGNYFHEHRARGMLIQALNGVVEDNVVRRPTMSGIELFTEATYFFEGPGAENVIVKNNTFDGCGYGNYGTGFDTMGAINMSAGVPTGISAYGVDKNILIDGNVVSDAPGLAIFVSSASGITVSNNIVINSNTLGVFPPWYGSAIGVVPHGSIMAAKASNVLLTDNLEVNRYQQPETGIYFDPGTTSRSSVQNNSQASPNAGGTLSLTGAYVSGSPLTLLARPDAGARFVNWTDNGNVASTSPSFSFTLHVNRHLLANFVPLAGAHLGNISTRAFVQTADNVMIGGFIVQGTTPKRVIIRAIGPELIQYGVPNALADPTLELHDGAGSLIASNNNWQTTIVGGIIAADQVQDIRDSGHAPGDARESAIIADLPAGNYTAIVRGVSNGVGVALVEVYDLSPASTSSLANISTRSSVQTRDAVMIGGFIVQGTQSKRVIVRAIGPELTQYGVPNALADPTLELHNGTGALIGRNDNWQTTITGGIITSTQVSAIQSSGHAPANANESAIVATLPPGNYTAIVRGENNTTGVALVEVYDLQ